MSDDTSYFDELTRVYNRRYLNEKMQEQVQFFFNSKTPFSVVMVDIDHFKEINDLHGHLKGDAIIREFANFLKNSLRISDTVVRYGGDEFMFLMPASTKQNAEQICRRIAERCRLRLFVGLNVTLSAGIAAYPEDGPNFITLVERADHALYDAKRSGRDRVGIAGEKKAEIPIRVFINRLPEKELIKKTIYNKEKKIRAAVITGTVGAGKTRLSKEVLNDLKGKEIIWADCIAFEESIAYFPIREMIKYHIKRLGKQMLHELPTAYAVEIGKLVPEIMDEIRDKIDNVQMVMDKYRLYEGIRRVIELGEGEKIIVIDNIQWIDSESVEIIKYLLRTLRDMPVVFIFIYRVEEKNDILEDFFCHISREHEVNEVKLKPFSKSEIKEAIKAIIGEEPSAKLIEYISQESGGIPFYVEEIMRALINDGHLVLVENQWKFQHPKQEIVPKNLIDIAIAKYRILTNEARNVVDLACVIGWFDINILKEMTGYNEGQLLGVVNDINRAGLIKFTQNRYEFSEAITRNALYTKYVKGPRARDLHMQIAQLLETQYKGKEQDVTEILANHYYHARHLDNGVRYCMLAGDKSQQQYANDDARKYYTWAMDLLSDEQETALIAQRIECLDKRGYILRHIGKYKEALVDCNQATQLAQQIGDIRLQANCLLKQAGIYSSMSEFDKTLAIGKESMELYEQINDKSGIVGTLRILGSVYYDRGENAKAQEYYEESVRIARELNEPSNLAKSLLNLGNSYYRKGDFNRALELYDEAHRTFTKEGEKTVATMALGNIANIHRQIGDTENALKLYEEVLATFREVGNKWCTSAGLINAGECYRSFGEYKCALQYLLESLSIEKDLGSVDGELMARSAIGTIYLDMGDFEKAEIYLKDALFLAEKIKAHHLIAACYDILGEIRCERDEYEKAKEYYFKAYELAKESPDTLRDILADMCDLFLVQGDLSAYEKYIAELEILYTTIIPRRLVAVMDWLKGRYYTIMKDFEKANNHLSNAYNVMKELDEKLGTIKVLLYLGDLEQERNDQGKARDYYSEGLAMCNAIEARGWAGHLEGRLNK